VKMRQYRRLRYIGLDVHRATIAVAIADEEGPRMGYGTTANDPTAVRKLMTRLGGSDLELRVAYEAGPTGYALHRQLARLDIDCMVVAPSLIPERRGNKVKTDRRDALKLARLLRSGDLTPVWVPDREHEAMRNLVRARADAKVDELRAKHRLSKFLLRLGVHPPIGMRNWSQRYFQWRRRVAFEHLADRVVFADYLVEVTAAGERIKRLEAALRQCAESSDQRALIRALQAFRGIGFLSAVSIVAEAGDVRRFRTAPHFMAYVGAVPSERSSGSKQHRGPITKTGNSLLRHGFGEAAHHARHAPRVGVTLKQRQLDLPPPVVELAWRAQLRLHHRYRHLGTRIGAHKGAHRRRSGTGRFRLGGGPCAQREAGRGMSEWSAEPVAVVAAEHADDSSLACYVVATHVL
jgi:transposase